MHLSIDKCNKLRMKGEILIKTPKLYVLHESVSINFIAIISGLLTDLITVMYFYSFYSFIL